MLLCTHAALLVIPIGAPEHFEANLCFACRIVAAADIKQPPVLFRARVHSAPVLYMAFNPSNNLLVTASINQTVCFLQVRGSEYVKVLGYAAVPGKQAKRHQGGLSSRFTFQALALMEAHIASQVH